MMTTAHNSKPGPSLLLPVSGMPLVALSFALIALGLRLLDPWRPMRMARHELPRV